MNSRFHRRIVTGSLGAAAIFALPAAQAQQALTSARQANQASAARSAAAADGGAFNQGSGGLKYSLSSSLLFEYNSNVRLNGNSGEDDYRLRPQISGGLSWQVTDYTRLGVSAGVGYDYYFNDSDRGGVTFEVSPVADNDIGFEVLIGDWRLYVYDRFGFRSDPVRDNTVSNSDDITEFNNTAGLQANYSLDNSSLSAGYAYAISLFEDSQFSDNDRDSHLFNASYQYAFNPAFVVGLEGSASMTVYNQGTRSDSTVYSLGPTVQWRPTEFITLTGGGGPSWVTYSANNAGFAPEDSTSIYFYSSIDHQFSQFASHSLSITRSSASGIRSANNQTTRYAYDVQLDIIEKVRLSLGAFYEEGDSVSGINTASDQTYSRVGGRASASRSFGDHLSTTLGYSFTHRDSDTAGGDYDQHRVTLTATFKF